MIFFFAFAKVKRLRNMNQDLQKVCSHLITFKIIIGILFMTQRLEEIKTQYESLVKNEQRLKAEVAQLKNCSSDGKLV